MEYSLPFPLRSSSLYHLSHLLPLPISLLPISPYPSPPSPLTPFLSLPPPLLHSYPPLPHSLPPPLTPLPSFPPSSSNPRFVVTLSGVPDNIEQAESLSKQPYSPITSPTTLTQSTTSESLTRKSIKDRLGVKQVQEAESVEEIVKEEEEDYGAQGGGLPERCRFWPNCKNGDSCPYHHPTVPCKLFPDCKYGKKCLYVHPQCKFNARLVCVL